MDKPPDSEAPDRTHVLRHATEISRKIAQGAASDTVLEYARDALKSLTRSKHCYIGECMTKNNLKSFENPQGSYIRCITADAISWDTDSLRYTTSGQPIELCGGATLYGQCLLRGEPLVLNSTRKPSRADAEFKSPGFKGEPVGLRNMLDQQPRAAGAASVHTTATKTLMVLPVMYAGAVIGQIGIANGAKYSDDVTSQVEILTLMISNVIQTRRSQREKEELIRKEELIKARDLFMANISHEIRTPLNSVIGMLALLQDSQLSEIQIEYVDIARRSSYSLLSLINDILDITKLEANKMSLNYKVVNIRDIIERSIDVVLSATVKRIPIRTIISEQVPLHVDTDGERIRQMLINLLNNAVKFTEDGQIVIRIEPATPEDITGLDLPPIAEHTPPAPSLRVVGGSRRLSGGDEPVRLFTRPDRSLSAPDDLPRTLPTRYLKFSVSDTGIGIKSEDVSRLFQSFVQLDASKTRAHSGTGLGLSIVHKICELMGGAISVHSEFGRGTTFYFVIPLREAPAPKKDIDVSVLAGKNVLVVDDLHANLLRVTKVLDRYNVDHRESVDPSNALTMYAFNKKHQFDLGLIDMVMPGMDGNKFAERVSGGDRPFPLIALSSLGENINDIGLHFADHIRKPFTDEQLIQAMVTVLERAAPTDPTSSECGSSVSSEEDRRVTHGGETPRRPALNSSGAGSTLTQPLEVVYSGAVRGRGKELLKARPYYEPVENHGINILIVDDVQDNVKVIEGFLRRLGYHNISTAKNGQEAVDMVARNGGSPLPAPGTGRSKRSYYHVVLMDVLMPVMDGITATKKITALFPKRKHRPTIIVITAVNVDGALAADIEEYADGVLTKPIVEIDRLGQALKGIKKK